MTELSENPILEYLRAIRGDVAGMRGKLGELFTRRVGVESHLARIDTHLAHLSGEIFHAHARVDALEARMERIERRLELAP